MTLMNDDICDNCGSTCETCGAEIMCAQCALELDLGRPHGCKHPDGVPVF